jgi:predicted anti-sigma-YlaC factor YlaD
MMHDIVVDELERHLSGKASRAFYDHLDVCRACRSEVSQMEELSRLLREIRASEAENGFELAPQPSAGFYNRVSWRIVERQRKEAWGLFSPGAVFFRRVAFASLLLLAGLGSFLISREASFSGTDAAAIMAQHDPSTDHTESSDRDRMLVTLATYHE